LPSIKTKKIKNNFLNFFSSQNLNLGISTSVRVIDVLFHMSIEGSLTFAVNNHDESVKSVSTIVRAKDNNNNNNDNNKNVNNNDNNDNDSDENSNRMITMLSVYLFLMFILYIVVKVAIPILNK
jgi:hypothetical protein